MGVWKTSCMQHKVRLLKEISALYKDCLRLQVLPAVSPVTVSLGYFHHGSCSIEIWLQFPPFSSRWVSQRVKALPKLPPLHKHLSLVCTSFTTDELSRDDGELCQEPDWPLFARLHFSPRRSRDALRKLMPTIKNTHSWDCFKFRSNSMHARTNICMYRLSYVSLQIDLILLQFIFRYLFFISMGILLAPVPVLNVM